MDRSEKLKYQKLGRTGIKVSEIEGLVDLLKRWQIDYIDIGMIYYIDTQSDFNDVSNGEIIKYALKLKKQLKYLVIRRFYD